MFTWKHVKHFYFHIQLYWVQLGLGNWLKVKEFIWCWQFEKLTFFFWIWAGIIGGVVGLVSKHQYVHGLAIICATYATNLAIVTSCCCGNKNLFFLKLFVMWLCWSFNRSLCLFSFFIFFSSFIKAILKSHEISIATYNCLPLRV